MKEFRGLSLLEAVVAVAIFGTLTLLVLSFWETASRSFFYSTVREDITTETRRAVVTITSHVHRTDGELTLVRSDRVWTNAQGQSFRRDAICFTDVENWKDPSAIDKANASIRWNVYRTIYATRRPEGKLVLETQQPSTPPYNTPWPPGVSDSFLQDVPTANAGARSVRVLSDSLESLLFNYDPERRLLVVDLTLARQGAKKTDGRNINERSQVVVKVRLENTSL